MKKLLFFVLVCLGIKTSGQTGSPREFADANMFVSATHLDISTSIAFYWGDLSDNSSWGLHFLGDFNVPLFTESGEYLNQNGGVSRYYAWQTNLFQYRSRILGIGLAGKFLNKQLTCAVGYANRQNERHEPAIFYDNIGPYIGYQEQRSSDQGLYAMISAASWRYEARAYSMVGFDLTLSNWEAWSAVRFGEYWLVHPGFGGYLNEQQGWAPFLTATLDCGSLTKSQLSVYAGPLFGWQKKGNPGELEDFSSKLSGGLVGFRFNIY